jgi:hypothetical protein
MFLVVRYLGAEDEVGPVTTDFEAVAVLDPPPVVGKMTNAKKLRRKSQKIEDGIAQGIGGRRNKGSGSLSYLKGDVRKRGHLRVESKFTQRKSYSVTLDELHKIDSECSHGETPAFDITFVEPVSLREIESWVLIPRTEWQRLLEVDSAATENQGSGRRPERSR